MSASLISKPPICQTVWLLLLFWPCSVACGILVPRPGNCEHFQGVTEHEGGFVLFYAQSLSRVQLFVTPWTRALQASLSFTVSQGQLKFMSMESVMLSNHLILCCPLLFNYSPSYCELRWQPELTRWQPWNQAFPSNDADDDDMGMTCSEGSLKSQQQTRACFDKKLQSLDPHPAFCYERHSQSSYHTSFYFFFRI